MVIRRSPSQVSVRRWRAMEGVLPGLLVTGVPVLGFLLLGLLLPGLSACRSEQSLLGKPGGESNVVTQVQMVRPAVDRVASSSASSALDGSAPDGVAAEAAPGAALPQDRPERDAIDEANVYCRQVEQQARETHAGLPKRLDRDTSATRVVAYGCDVVLEYAMHDLNVEQVAPEGLRALRSEVVNKLCADGGARTVMDRGGSFTNVYRDQRSALIDQFTITAEDCASPLPAEAPVSFDL